MLSFVCFSQQQNQIVKGKVQSETSKSILQNVHVLNLTKVKGTITNLEGEFEINAKLNLTLNKTQKRNVEIAMSNTFGFGGHNTCVIFKKYDQL